MITVYVVGGLVALLLATGLTPLVKKFAIKVGAVDVPNARKVHTRIMPRMGGLGILLLLLSRYVYWHYLFLIYCSDTVIPA